MRKTFWYRFCVLGLLMLPVWPACAQGKKNLPKALSQAVTGSPAFQKALRHAQAAGLIAGKPLEIPPPSAPIIRTAPASANYRTKYSRQEWLEKLETFVEQNGRFPGRLDEEERKLLQAISAIPGRFPPDDPVVMRIQELQQQYPRKVRLSPQEWLEKLELFIEQNGRFPTAAYPEGNPQEQRFLISLGGLLDRLDPNDPIALRIRELRQLYPAKPRGFPPQYWLEKLETFVEQNDRMPRPSGDEAEVKLYNALASIVGRQADTDPVVVRIRELQQLYRVEPTGQTPEQWLEKLEAFVQEKGTFPRRHVEEELKEEDTLRAAVTTLLRKLPPTHPVVQRIQQLREQFYEEPEHQPAQDRVKQLETFIEENGFFPRYNATGEEKHLYNTINGILSRFPFDHLLVIHIRKLRESCK